MGLAALAAVAPAAGAATSPTPDPPPLAVSPEPPQPAPQAPTPAPKAAVRQAPVVTRTVVTETPVVTRTVVTPVVVTRDVPARRAPAPAQKPKPVAKKASPPAAKPKTEPVVVRRTAHDRPLLPLPAAEDVAAAVEEIDRGPLALAAGALAFVALGGAVVLLAARRQLGELSR